MLLKKIITEPLSYFVFVALLFMCFEGYFVEKNDTITISSQEIQGLKEKWQKAYFRTPSADELSSLTDELIKEKMFYQQALAQALDKNDVNIRYLLYKKMVFLAEAQAVSKIPDDKQLKQFYQDNIARYQQAVRFNVTVKKISPQWLKTQQTIEGFNILNHNITFEHTQFQQSAHDQQINNVTIAELKQQLPNAWLTEINDSSQSGWLTPIWLNAYYLAIHIQRLPTTTTHSFAQQKANVIQDYIYQQKKAAEFNLYQSLKAKYTVTLAGPQ